MADHEASPRRLKWAATGSGVLAFAALALALPPSIARLTSSQQPATSNRPTVTAPAEPPVIEFIGEAPATAGEAKLEFNGKRFSTQLGPDDAEVVWLRVPPAEDESLAFASSASPRRIRLPLVIRDEDARDYAYVAERIDGDIVALRIKRGYDRLPRVLRLSQRWQSETVASWKLQSLPKPAPFIARGAKTNEELGSVQLEPARSGRLVGVVYLQTGATQYTGVILRPVGASFVRLSDTVPPLVARVGEPRLFGRIPIPNPEMAKHVAFDLQRYKPETTTETVTFRTARLENRASRTTFVVDAAERVVTPSGLVLNLIKQKSSVQPFRVEVNYDPQTLQRQDGREAPPFVEARLLTDQPPMALSFHSIGGDGPQAAATSPPSSRTPSSGNISELKVEIKIIRPRVIDSKRIILPVIAEPVAPGVKKAATQAR